MLNFYCAVLPPHHNHGTRTALAEKRLTAVGPKTANLSLAVNGKLAFNRNGKLAFGRKTANSCLTETANARSDETVNVRWPTLLRSKTAYWTSVTADVRWPKLLRSKTAYWTSDVPW